MKQKGYKEFLREKAEMKDFYKDQESQTSVELPDGDKTIDDLRKSSAPVLKLYSNDEEYSIDDNATLYEIVKLFKDITDKHFYIQNFAYDIDVRNKAVTFRMIAESDDTTEEQLLDAVGGMINQSVKEKFGNAFDIEMDMVKIGGDEYSREPRGIPKLQLTVVVREKTNKEKAKGDEAFDTYEEPQDIKQPEETK